MPSEPDQWTLSTRDPGAFGISSWTVTTPEGAQHQLIWDSAENHLFTEMRDGAGQPLLRPILGEEFRIQPGNVRDAQRVVERFVNKLRGIEPEEVVQHVSRRRVAADLSAERHGMSSLF